jgi:hypothetical protein
VSILVVMPMLAGEIFRCAPFHDPSRYPRWAVDFDDENRQFLILFGERQPEYQTAPTQETPFTLTGGPPSRKTAAKARPGQQRFKAKSNRTLGHAGCPRQDHEDRQRECSGVLGSLNLGSVPAGRSMRRGVMIDQAIVG